MDTPASESTLNTDTAASAIAALLEPAPVEEPKNEEAETQEEPKEEPKAEEPEATEEAKDDPTVTVKIDGKDVEVKLSELKNGYQRQADYTRKTMEVADTRKGAEAEKAKAAQERQTYAQNLQRMQAQLEGVIAEQNKTINWEQLLNSDPVEYLRQRHLADARQAQLQQVNAEGQRVAAQMQAEAEKARQSHVEQQQQELLAKLPEWKDEAKAKADKAALRDYLLESGYDRDSVDAIANARDVLLARKAMLYDQMMSKAQAAAKKVAAAPTKVLQPGNGAQGLDKRTSAFQRLGKTGKVEDAASVIASLL